VLDRAESVTAPVLLHAGAEDTTIPADQVWAIDSALSVVPLVRRNRNR
jgi:carboxymethylenebutenolidase